MSDIEPDVGEPEAEPVPEHDEAASQTLQDAAKAAHAERYAAEEEAIPAP